MMKREKTVQIINIHGWKLLSMKIKYLKIKTLSKKLKIFNIRYTHKRRYKYFQGPQTVCFFQSVTWHSSTFALTGKETRPPPAPQSSYFSEHLWGSVLKASWRETPCTLGDALIRGRTGLTYPSVLRKSSKGQCLWYERRKVNMRQKALRAPLAIGRWGRKEPSYK